MTVEAWYYLHTNGSLIYKRELGGKFTTLQDIHDSDFCRAYWFVDPEDREGAWNILVEGLALGADGEQILRLAERWGCTNEDAVIYAEQVGCELQGEGKEWVAYRMDAVDPLSEPQRSGYGNCALSAMANLASILGLKARKPMNPGFAELLRVSVAQ